MRAIARIAALAGIALVGALAATLVTELRAAPAASHNLAVGGCDPDGVRVSYHVAYSQAAAAFAVTAVTLGDVDAACRDATASVALRAPGGAELASASATVAGGALTLPLSPRPRAADVVEVAVELAGAGDAPGEPPASAVAPVAAPPAAPTDPASPAATPSTPDAPVLPPAAPPVGRSPLCNVADRGSVSLCLVGRATPSRLVGSAGRDVLVAGPAGDVLLGRGGADFLYGGRGNDRIAGGDGADLIEGRGGGDRLYGGRGNDRIRGGAGNDRIEGGRGDDVIDGGPGRDVCIGGPGRDRFARCEVIVP